MNNSMPAFARIMHRPAPRQAGFTLIEMMIAITIGLGIIAGLVGVLASTSNNARTNDRTSELMTNGRYALNSMKQELREAGFLGYTYDKPNATAAIAVTGCVPDAEVGATVASCVSNVAQGIWGANNNDPFSGSCIPATSYAAGNDILVVRRLDPIPTAPDPAKAGEVYFRSSYERGQIFQGVTLPVLAGSPLATFRLKVYVYYISPFTVAATESPLMPALYRVSLDSTGAMVRELVASGIERMQVQYGIKDGADTQYLDIPAGDSSNPADPGRWTKVNSVRIWLLARNSTVEQGYVNNTAYAMGDAPAFTPSDGFRRQLFTTVVQLRN
jgi:type IV pilus assembly protein PilW